MSKSDLGNLSLSLTVKLGSMVVHAAEYLAPGGHDFDRAAMQTLICDPEVIVFVEKMDKAGFMPKKRTSL